MNFKEFSAASRSELIPTTRSMLPEIAAPAQQISRVFQMQSYFDSTLLQNAILSQPRNEPIVPSTVLETQIPGYAIGLHPDSQTPVAIQFKVGGQPSSSQVLVLKPGQIVRPYGRPMDDSSGSFSGFRWGIPFGWLGGGVATLVVFPTSDVRVDWNEHSELIFHRQRMQILDPATITTDAPFNWPMQFPWIQAFSGVSATSQQGQPQIAVTPTRTIMSLRTTTLADPATMRVFAQASTDFDVDSTGTVVTSPVRFVDHTWGSFAALAGPTGNLATAYPLDDLSNLIVRLAADGGGIRLADASGTAALTGLYVDVVRYCKL